MESETIENKAKSFFRYRSISVNSLSEIATSSFYLANPTTFNDPFDCDFYWKENTEEERIDHIYSCGKEHDEEGVQLNNLNESKSLLEQKIRKDINELGVACFTTDPINSLMWSHYGDNHKGICIEYKQDGILLNPELFRKVAYDRDQKMVWNSLDIDKDIELLHSFLQDVVFRKLPEWKYEEEWRLMAIQPKERVCNIPGAVLSVTFGLKCVDIEVEKVINILKFHFSLGLIDFYSIRRAEDGGLVRLKLDNDINIQQ